MILLESLKHITISEKRFICLAECQTQQIKEIKTKTSNLKLKTRNLKSKIQNSEPKTLIQESNLSTKNLKL